MAQRYTKRQLGDRADGRKLRTIPSSDRLIPYMIRTRVQAQESYRETVELSDASGWLSGKLQEGVRDLGMTQIVAAAFVRTVANCPWLNRFVAGQRIYARNDLEIILPGSGENNRDSVKASFSDNDTIMDVYYKLGDHIENLKAGSSRDTAERFTDFIMLLPRFLIRFAVQTARLLDYYGLWSRHLLSLSPWHGSLSIYDNSAAELNTNALPLSNFGNISVSVCLGKIRDVYEPDSNGRLIPRRLMDIDITVDRRIANKAEIEAAIMLWKHYIENPRELERAPKRVRDDET